ncbi:hypothetical protein VPH35_089647 [Triticum aestivum]
MAGCNFCRNRVAYHFIIWAGFDICCAPSLNISRQSLLASIVLVVASHGIIELVGFSFLGVVQSREFAGYLRFPWWAMVGCNFCRNRVAYHFIIWAGFDICCAPSLNILRQSLLASIVVVVA